MDAALKFIEIVGIIAFALSGLIEGRKKGLDMVGIYFVSLITAFGGGTARDLLLNNYPVFWIQHAEYPVIVLALSLSSLLFRGAPKNSLPLLWALTVFDGLGLGLFCASGISLSLARGISPFNAALMGIITGAFGGVLRDIICNEIPAVFRRTELYVTCILVGVLGYLVMFHGFKQQVWALVACIILTLASRILAHKYQWRLPV